ncbi:MAG: 4-hydroxy-tetrahydrodipicolinate synthase [Ferruginibacter sp.]|nr:4-hydroxy-tetrahydrodipicolinate synthase [Ferruginibacter sp.]MCB0709734.1 4-hydroxy-tetrahydrodipicolinate synthase [Chitinophagaceae bacterium]MCC7378098.1 4-hydroxy-tetrahydrodipicolinate synthase [Chitinophagaceae bacterium]
MNLRTQLKGTGVAIVTPFKKNMLVDFDALGKLIDFIINNKVEYIVTLGTTGETPVLDAVEKEDIINYTFEKVNGRVPIVVGVGGNNTKEVMESLQSLPLEKATAILSASPYYNKPSQEGIFQHYKYLAEASPKPLILYNVPGRTGSNITADTTLRLAYEVENIAGIKEASGNMIQCMQVLKDRPENFLVVSGDDHLTLPLIACGMDGVISVAANCFPASFSEMVRLCLNNNFNAARPLHYKCLQGNNLLFAENNPAGVKAFLFEMGLIENVLRFPLVPLSNSIHQQIKDYLKE